MKTMNTKQLRTVTILVRYTVNKTGTVILLVENDKSIRYYCTLNENSTHSCSCPATKECYHLKAVITVENARKAKWEVYRATLAKQLARQYVSTTVVTDMLKAALTTDKGFSLLR